MASARASSDEVRAGRRGRPEEWTAERRESPAIEGADEDDEVEEEEEEETEAARVERRRRPAAWEGERPAVGRRSTSVIARGSSSECERCLSFGRRARWDGAYLYRYERGGQWWAPT